MLSNKLRWTITIQNLSGWFKFIMLKTAPWKDVHVEGRGRTWKEDKVTTSLLETQL